jgi:hypothetical protein
VWDIPADRPYSQPFWLVLPRTGESYNVPDQALVDRADILPVAQVRYRIRTGGEVLEFVRAVQHRYVDKVEGERTRPVAIVPPVAVQLAERVRVFPDSSAKKVEIGVQAQSGEASGQLRLKSPPGWRAAPQASGFQLQDSGALAVLPFGITPPAAPGAARLEAVAEAAGFRVAAGIKVIEYPHIPAQTVFPAAEAKLVRADIRVLATKVGYIMGAGDQVPEALRQLGCEVTLLTAEDLARGDLSRFEAIVTGVRAYNIRSDLRANEQRLFDYIQAGGAFVVQYNVLDAATAKIGPYPLRIGRARVSVEEAPVTFPNPASPLLHTPNRITAADFEGWVQERGLYFAAEWDPRYRTLFSSHDPGEEPQAGGTLYTRYGDGAFVFTAYSWFRQLPAGVPGAYRIFANLLSAGKVLR